MAETWIVRVGGKEYGPVDLGTLTDWKREGRLLPANEVRASAATTWTTADTIPGLFMPPPLPAPRNSLDRRRDFTALIRDSLRVYRLAFLPFFVITLLVAVPAFVLELMSPAYGIFPQGGAAGGVTRSNVIALIAFVILLVNWPIFLAAIQLATRDVLEGQRVRVSDLLRRAVNFFPRVARLSLLVYGSYIFWTVLPLIAIISVVSASPTIPAILLALALLAIQVMMVARLFANFLFWQQSAVIGGCDGIDAIRESKLLARSQRRPRKLQRPLWRGALLASLWLLVLLGLSSGAEIPLVFTKLQSVSSPEQLLALLQNLSSAQSPDAMLIATAAIGSLMHALVRPVLGIAFVLLYFDARADFTKEELVSPTDSA